MKLSYFLLYLLYFYIDIVIYLLLYVIVDEPFGSINEVIHSQFLGFFENEDIEEYISDRSGIGEVRAKTMFNQGRSKGKFQCFHKAGHE